MKSLLLAFVMLWSGPALAQTVPEINFDSVPDFPKLPKGMNFGEVPGVAVNSRGHIYVFTRSNSATGPALPQKVQHSCAGFWRGVEPSSPLPWQMTVSAPKVAIWPAICPLASPATSVCSVRIAAARGPAKAVLGSTP